MRFKTLARIIPWLGLLPLAGCDPAKQGSDATHSQFQTEFIASCVNSIRNPSFSWMPQSYAPNVCQCAAPRIEAQLHHAGLDTRTERSATELAAASHIITANMVECAKPVFVTVMSLQGRQHCIDQANTDPRINALSPEARENACSCAGQDYAKAANLGLALQSEKHAEFERQSGEQLRQALDTCLKK